MNPAEKAQARAEPPGWFTTTHWTVVLNAKSEDTVQASEALSRLCQTYWGPVHTYIRQAGHALTDAEDLTQQFFARFLQKEHYRMAARERGRFRSFLLTSVKHFLVNEWEKASAKKRGGGETAVSLDEEMPGEDRPRVEVADNRTADQIYERNWAMTLLQRVRERLQSTYIEEGKGDWFAQLEKFLPGEESEVTYAEAGVRFGIAEGTVKSDVHRLKAKYRTYLREEIANTVLSPEEIEEELRHLIAVLGQVSG